MEIILIILTLVVLALAVTVFKLKKEAANLRKTLMFHDEALHLIRKDIHYLDCRIEQFNVDLSYKVSYEVD